MDLYNKTLKEFANLVDSDYPAPGGGSTSALMSVLSLSLARMVGHLTINKKKFLRLDEDIQKDFNNTLNNLLSLKEQIIPLIDKDTDSFNLIMKAFRMPRETDLDKEKRKEAIKLATIEAIKTPYEIAKLSLEALKTYHIIVSHGNVSAISDLGVGILALASGIEGAIYNVLINLIGFSDKEMVSFYKKEAKDILAKTEIIKKELQKQIFVKLEY